MLQRAVNRTVFASPTKSNQKGANIFNIQFELLIEKAEGEVCLFLIRYFRRWDVELR
jgi:hypothetical protein